MEFVCLLLLMLSPVALKNARRSQGVREGRGAATSGTRHNALPEAHADQREIGTLTRQYLSHAVIHGTMNSLDMVACEASA